MKRSTFRPAVISLVLGAGVAGGLAMRQSPWPGGGQQGGRTQGSQGNQAPGQPAAMPPSAAGRITDPQAIDSNVSVPIQQTPVASPVNSNVSVPIGQTPTMQAPQPANVGFNNPGGIVDSSQLEQQALSGVHYHYHYYGPGTFTSNQALPGYSSAGYQNPATAAVPVNPYMTAPIGPGNPAPMNTLAGEYGFSNNPVEYRGGPAPNPELVGGAAGSAAGQAWSYGGGIGYWNPYAMGGNGFIEGFND
jgi:hypothetical protein